MSNGIVKEIFELVKQEINARNGNGSTPLILSALDGQKDMAPALIEKGADVNARNSGGATPLIVAAFNGHKDIAASLIEKGADVNARDNNGAIPLILAAFNGHKDVAELLTEGVQREEVVRFIRSLPPKASAPA